MNKSQNEIVSKLGELQSQIKQSIINSEFDTVSDLINIKEEYVKKINFEKLNDENKKEIYKILKIDEEIYLMIKNKEEQIAQLLINFKNREKTNKKYKKYLTP